MRDNWTWATLGEVTTKIGSGATPRGGKSVYRASGVALIRSQNVLDHMFSASGLAYIDDTAAAALAAVTVRTGDVLVNLTGDSVARCCVAPSGVQARVSQHVAIVRPKKDRINSRFLAAYLASPHVKAQLRQLAGGGATRPALTKSHLMNLPVRLPPLASQEAIAAVFRVLDEKIDANRGLVRVARELARGLLQRAAEGGQWHSVGEAAEVRKGLSYTGAGLSDAGIPMVNLANAEELGWLKRSGFKNYTGPHKPRHVARGGSLLVSGVDLTWKLRIIGWPMLLPEDVPEALFSQDVFLIDFPPEHDWLRLPLWAYLYTPEARARLEGMAYGTTVARFPADALTGLEFPAPKEGAPVLEAAYSLLRRAWAAERESAALTELRDALLPPLLSGELRVRDAETLVGEAV